MTGWKRWKPIVPTKKTVERRPVARLNLIHFSTNLVCHPDIMSGLTVNKLHSVTRYEVTPTERQTEDVLVEPFLLLRFQASAN